jgi:hypothetical protein
LGPDGSRNPSSKAGKDLASEYLHFPPQITLARRNRAEISMARHSLTAEGACQIRCQVDTKMFGPPNIFQFLFFLRVDSMQATVMAPYKLDREKRNSAPRCLIAFNEVYNRDGRPLVD